jgi:four helix bundle protein
MRNFRELEIWKKAKQIVVDVYMYSAAFPKEEIYGLTSQIRRASVSIPSNIAEGASRSSDKDFVRFLQIALGSSYELETQLNLSYDLKFEGSGNLSKLLSDLESLQKMINSFIQSVKKF